MTLTFFSQPTIAVGHFQLYESKDAFPNDLESDRYSGVAQQAWHTFPR